MRRQAFARGFTLLELMVSTSIVAILVVLGVPTISEFVAEQKVRTAASELQLALAQARSAASDRSAAIVLCPRGDEDRCGPDDDWSGGWLIYRGRATDDGPPQPSALLARVDRPAADGVEIRSGMRRRIVFQPDGSAGGSNATFRICARDSGARQRRIVLSNAGRSRVQVDAATGCPASP